MTAKELEQLMVEAFGEDFRAKAIVGPVGVFSLAGVFEECGLRDPKAPPPADQPRGLWQVVRRCR